MTDQPGPNYSAATVTRTVQPQPLPAVDKLLPALIAAKQKFGKVLKDKNNPAFKTKYADLGAVLDAVEPALLENGLVLIQPTSTDDQGNQACSTYLVHTSGQYLSATYPLKPVKQDPQGVGSALTYARRYMLLSLLGLAPEDDDGNAASNRASANTPAAPPRDWVKEAKALSTSDQVKDLGRAAAAVGEFEGTVKNELFAIVADLTAKEKEAAEKTAAEQAQEAAGEPDPASGS